MKKHWESLRIRLESMALRERAMILAASALTLAFLLDAVLIEPELARRKDLQDRLALQQNEIRQMRAAADAVRQFRRDDETAQIAKRIERLKAQLADSEEFVHARSEHLSDAGKVAPLLEQLLHNDSLVEFKTLPAALLIEPGGAGEKIAPKIYRHGVQVTVRGSYQQLLSYLAALEKTRVFWGEVSIGALNRPEAEMTLNVYTLSLDPVWLKVSRP